MEGHDYWTRENTRLLSRCHEKQAYEEHKRHVRKYGLGIPMHAVMTAHEPNLMRGYLTYLMTLAVTDANLLTLRGGEYTKMPKGFWSNAILWLESRGFAILGWPLNLPPCDAGRGKLEWPMSIIYALTYMLMTCTVRIVSRYTTNGLSPTMPKRRENKYIPPRPDLIASYKHAVANEKRYAPSGSASPPEHDSLKIRHHKQKSIPNATPTLSNVVVKSEPTYEPPDIIARETTYTWSPNQTEGRWPRNDNDAPAISSSTVKTLDEPPRLEQTSTNQSPSQSRLSATNQKYVDPPSRKSGPERRAKSKSKHRDRSYQEWKERNQPKATDLTLSLFGGLGIDHHLFEGMTSFDAERLNPGQSHRNRHHI